jgi:diaminopimelate decarboxylase
MAFAHRNGVLCAEGVALDDIARLAGTPCYVYSRESIEVAYREFAGAPGGRQALVAYSVKANSNLAILALLARLGAGFDIVSGGELARVLAAGGEARKVLFSGVGKSEREIAQALQAGIRCLNLESEEEMRRVAQVAARLGRRAPVAFRVNPDVDAGTHPYISTGLRTSKFGVPYEDAPRLYALAAQDPSLDVVGIGCHIGSLMMGAGPFVDAARRIRDLVERLDRTGLRMSHVDLGGGFGIRYRDEAPAPVREFLDGAQSAFAGRTEDLIVDPGRALVGNAGLLLTRVEYVKTGKERNFLVVDAAMNDLLRPSLYDAWHDVRPVHEPGDRAAVAVYDVVGPVCESADFLAKGRPLAARSGDLLAIMSAGAYGMVMSSNYNSRPRAAEVLVDGSRFHVVRRRETVEQLYAGESIPPW